MTIVKSPFRYAKEIEDLCPYSELKFRNKVRHNLSLPVCSATPCDKQAVPNGRLIRANAYGAMLALKEDLGASDYEYIEVSEAGGHYYILTTFSQPVKFVIARRTYGIDGDDYTFWATATHTNIQNIPSDRYVYLPFRGTKIYTAAKLVSSRYKIDLYGFF